MLELPSAYKTLEHFYGISEVLRRPDSSSSVIRHDKRVVYPDESDVTPTLTMLGIDPIQAEEPVTDEHIVRKLVQSIGNPIRTVLRNHLSHP